MSTRHQPTKRRREHCRTTLSKTFQRRTLTRRNENQTQRPGCKGEGRNSQTFKTDDHPVQTILEPIFAEIDSKEMRMS